MDPMFRLGVNIPVRDTTKFNQVPTTKTPVKLEPNRGFSPIQDNREQILERIKKEIDQQFVIRSNTLPLRT